MRTSLEQYGSIGSFAVIDILAYTNSAYIYSKEKKTFRSKGMLPCRDFPLLVVIP